MLSSFTEATKESNKVFNQISTSIEQVGESIGNGLALLAQALSGMQNPQRPQQTPATSNVWICV